MRLLASSLGWIIGNLIAEWAGRSLRMAFAGSPSSLAFVLLTGSLVMAILFDVFLLCCSELHRNRNNGWTCDDTVNALKLYTTIKYSSLDWLPHVFCLSNNGKLVHTGSTKNLFIIITNMTDHILVSVFSH